MHIICNLPKILFVYVILLYIKILYKKIFYPIEKEHNYFITSDCLHSLNQQLTLLSALLSLPLPQILEHQQFQLWLLHLLIVSSNNETFDVWTPSETLSKKFIDSLTNMQYHANGNPRLTWSWMRSWKFPSCSICCSYNLFLFKHCIAAARRNV